MEDFTTIYDSSDDALLRCNGLQNLLRNPSDTWRTSWLDECQGSDGYWYKPMVTVLFNESSIIPSQNNMFYVVVEVDYKYDWNGHYVLWFESHPREYKKMSKIESKYPHKVLRTQKHKLELSITEWPNLYTKVHSPQAEHSIQGNSLRVMQINDSGNIKNEIDNNTRAYAEDLAGIFGAVLSGVFEGISIKQAGNASFWNAELASQVNNYDNMVWEIEEGVRTQLQNRAGAIQSKTSWLPEGSVRDLLNQELQKNDSAAAKLIEEQGKNAIEELNLKQNVTKGNAESAAKWANRFKVAGKALSVAGYGLMFISLSYTYYECQKSGNQEPFKEAIYGFIASFATAAWAGAISGGETGAIAGPKGLIIGVIVGIAVGCIDFLLLHFTGKSLGGWINKAIKCVTETVDAVAASAAEKILMPAATPLGDQMLKHNSGGSINFTGGFDPSNFFWNTP